MAQQMAVTLQPRQVQSYAYMESNYNTKYYMSDGTHHVELQTVKGEKDSGVMITGDLKDHVHNVSCQPPKREKLQAWCAETSEDSIAKTSFSSIRFRPHLEYCIKSLSPYFREDIQCLEGVQRAATKLVPALRKRDYRQRLQKLGLTLLETRRRDDLIETFKIMMTGKEKLSSEQFFHLSTTGYQTRGHSLKIAKQCTRLNLRKQFFSQ